MAHLSYPPITSKHRAGNMIHAWTMAFYVFFVVFGVVSVFVGKSGLCFQPGFYLIGTLEPTNIFQGFEKEWVKQLVWGTKIQDL